MTTGYTIRLSAFVQIRYLLLVSCLLLTPATGNSQPPDTPGEPDDDSLQLSAESQHMAGLVTRRLSGTETRPALSASGRVEDITPLLNLLGSYRTALASLKTASTSLSSSAATYKRLQNLRRDEAASLRQLQEARSSWQMDQSLVNSARQQGQNLLFQIRRDWGNKLAEWISDSPDHPELQKLASSENQLILATLPQGSLQPLDQERTIRVYYSLPGRPQTQGSASLLSAATRVDPVTQGETWYFISQDQGLRSGMRLELRFADDRQPAGYRIPESAIVWHGGLPWIFAKTDETRFARLALPAGSLPGETWWIPASTLAPGSNIVVRGAQLLLSEQNRQLIPEEDDDDDDTGDAPEEAGDDDE